MIRFRESKFSSRMTHFKDALEPSLKIYECLRHLTI